MFFDPKLEGKGEIKSDLQGHARPFWGQTQKQAKMMKLFWNPQKRVQMTTEAKKGHLKVISASEVIRKSVH